MIRMLIAEDKTDADADADVNADGLAKQWARWVPPSPVVMARAPKCLLAAPVCRLAEHNSRRNSHI